MDEFLAEPSAGLRVEMKLRCNQVLISKHFTYPAEHVLYGGGDFPRFSLWPNVKILRDVTHNDGTVTQENCWKRYLVSMSDGIGIYAHNSPSDAVATLSSDNLKYHCTVPGAVKFRVTSKDDLQGDSSWEILRFKDFPEYLPLSFNYGQDSSEAIDIGCIYIKPAAVHRFGTHEAHMAIDFGTTNTTWKLQIGDTTQTLSKIFDPELVMVLQRIHHSGVSAQESTNFSGGIFHRLYWLSTDNDATVQKIRSIAQIYNSVCLTASAAKTDHHALEVGRAALLDGTVLAAFESESANNGLENVGIYTIMKYEHPATEGGKAAQCFIETLSVNSALCALLHGARSLTLHYSYPDKTSEDNQTEYWNAAAQLISDCVNVPDFQNDYQTMSECEGSARFICQNHAANLGLSVADIGGGTCDITLWSYASGTFTQLDSYSMHFAGNQLTAETLYTVFSKNPGGFRSVWTNIRNDEAFTELTSDDSRLSYVQANLRSVAGNFQYDMYRKELNTIASSVNSLLDIADPDTSGIPQAMSPSAPWSPKMHLCSLIRAKMAGCFYVIGQMLRRLPADTLPRFDNSLDVYNIALAGGGSQALTLCDPSFTERFLREMLSRELADSYVENTAPDAEKFAVVPPTNYDKTEVVNGMLSALNLNAPYSFSIPESSEDPYDSGSSRMNDGEALTVIFEGYRKFLPCLSTRDAANRNAYWFPYKSSDRSLTSLGDALDSLPEASVMNAVRIVYQMMKNSGELRECPAYLLPAVGAAKTLEVLLNLYL